MMECEWVATKAEAAIARTRWVKPGWQVQSEARSRQFADSKFCWKTVRARSDHNSQAFSMPGFTERVRKLAMHPRVQLATQREGVQVTSAEGALMMELRSSAR